MSSVKPENDDLPWLVNGSLDKDESAAVVMNTLFWPLCVTA